MTPSPEPQPPSEKGPESAPEISNRTEKERGDAALAELRARGMGSNRTLLRALLGLIIANRAWWLLPILMVLAFLSLFISLTGDASILPAIYALF